MGERDLLKGLAEPALGVARALVTATAAPEPLLKALLVLIDCSGLLLIAVGIATLGGLCARPRGRWAQPVVTVATAAAAAGLGAWVLRHPSDSIDLLFTRWDHLAFAGTAGMAMATLAEARRKWCLALVSTAVLSQYAGLLGVSVVGAMTAAGIGLMHTRLRSHRRAMIAAQAALVVAVYGFALWVRSWNFGAAFHLQGLLIVAVLRHIGLMVSAARDGPPRLVDCSAFMAFYPGAMGLLGAPEVYGEFARRNLQRPVVLHHRRAAERVVSGALLLTASFALPITLADIELSTTPWAAWARCVGFFLKTALAITGTWRLLDGTALLYGVQLRANFAGLFVCRNPSELWWSWRGTLTNWLVQHIYAPLGGSQRHQSLNIAAAFAVSFLWHIVGIPFSTPTLHPESVIAVALWAAINGAAVIIQVRVNRTGAARVFAPLPLWLRTAVATLLTWALASMTPILLSYQGTAASGLPRLLALLLGWR